MISGKPELFNIVSYISHEISKGRYFDELKKMLEKKKKEKFNLSEIEKELLEDIALKSKHIFNQSIREKIEKLYHAIKITFRNYRLNGLQIDGICKSRLTLGRSDGLGIIPTEIGVSFHPFYNVPYIPASTLKGAFRQSFKIYLKLIKAGKQTEIDETARKVFDGEDARSISMIWFFDAFPVNPGINGYLLVPDIITPHYTSNVNTECDVEPSPLIHLVIPEKTVFRFIIGYNINKLKEVFNGVSIGIDEFKNLNVPEHILNTMLIMGEIGIGGKTSIGYSTFTFKIDSLKVISHE